MEKLTVACVQQRMLAPASLDEYASSLRRILRVAQNRQARLVVLPELGGAMAAVSMLDDSRTKLLKRAARGAGRDAGFWQRVTGSLSGRLAGYLRADLRHSLAGLLDVAPVQVWGSYANLFGGLAKEFSVTLVAPSAYLPDPLDGVVRNLAAVFSASGDLLGAQAKVVPHPGDADLAQPGAAWDVIPTDAGRIGLILGNDVLYPEVGRVLAYQGADVLLAQAACHDLAGYNKVRAGVLARMQDNQLFAAASFLAGPDILSRDKASTYVGKSAIFAPQELTPRSNGVLVEMGGPRSEGVVVADWDFDALRQLWESSETPIRRTLSSAELGGALGQIYARLQRLPALADRPMLEPGEDESAAGVPDEVVTLDDLTVVDSYAQEWPSAGDAGEDDSAIKNDDPNGERRRPGDS